MDDRVALYCWRRIQGSVRRDVEALYSGCQECSRAVQPRLLRCFLAASCLISLLVVGDSAEAQSLIFGDSPTFSHMVEESRAPKLPRPFLPPAPIDWNGSWNRRPQSLMDPDAAHQEANRKAPLPWETPTPRTGLPARSDS